MPWPRLLPLRSRITYVREKRISPLKGSKSCRIPNQGKLHGLDEPSASVTHLSGYNLFLVRLVEKLIQLLGGDRCAEVAHNEAMIGL